MSKSSKPNSKGGARPFSFRPQDFGAPERVEKTETDEDERQKECTTEESSLYSEEQGVGSAGSFAQAGSLERALSSEASCKVIPKEEQTILMAVPPPAQENKGD